MRLLPLLGRLYSGCICVYFGNFTNLLELLLAAPVWRADGSDTAATAAAATPWGATPWQRQWQGDPGNDCLAFFHSSVFCTLSSTLLHTSIQP